MIMTALQMLWVEKKKSVNLCLMMAMTIGISIILLQFFNNPYINSTLHWSTIDQLMSHMEKALSTFFMLSICTVLIVYSCNYYVRLRSREIGLVKLAGYDHKQVMGYQIIQLLAMVVVASMIALVISVIMIPLLQGVAYTLLDSKENYFYISLDAFWQSIGTIGIVMITIIMVEIQYMIQASIPNLLKNDSIIAYKKRAKYITFVNAIYVFFYLVGIGSVHMGNLDAGFIVPSCMGAIGAYGITYYLIPTIFSEEMEKEDLAAEKHLVYGNTSLLLQQSKMLILLIMISVIMLSALLCSTRAGGSYHIQLHIVFFLTNMLLSFSLVNRFKMDGMEKKAQYRNIYKMGMTKEEIYQISKKEATYMYAVFWGLGGIYLLNTVISFVWKANMEIGLAILIGLEYAVPYLLSELLVLYNKNKEAQQW